VPSERACCGHGRENGGTYRTIRRTFETVPPAYRGGGLSRFYIQAMHPLLSVFRPLARSKPPVPVDIAMITN
jgi:hypothetical protein